jgi:hypothetical protein
LLVVHQEIAPVIDSAITRDIGLVKLGAGLCHWLFQKQRADVP